MWSGSFSASRYKPAEVNRVRRAVLLTILAIDWKRFRSRAEKVQQDDEDDSIASNSLRRRNSEVWSNRNRFQWRNQSKSPKTGVNWKSTVQKRRRKRSGHRRISIFFPLLCDDFTWWSLSKCCCSLETLHVLIHTSETSFVECIMLILIQWSILHGHDNE